MVVLVVDDGGGGGVGSGNDNEIYVDFHKGLNLFVFRPLEHYPFRTCMFIWIVKSAPEHLKHTQPPREYGIVDCFVRLT